MAVGGGFDAIATTASYCRDQYSATQVLFAFRKSTQSGADHYKIIRDNVDLTAYIPESSFSVHDDSSAILYYVDNTATNLSGHTYKVRTAEDTSGTNESDLSAGITLYVLAVVSSAYTTTPFSPVSLNPYNYVVEGGIGISRLRQERESSGGTEVYQSTRKTKWFAIGDYEKDAKVRRIKLSYKTNRPIKVKVYADHSTTPTHTLTFPQAGLKKIRQMKATLRAKLLQIEIVTDETANHYLEVYGIEVQTDG